MSDELQSIDPSKFDNPLAAATAWEPIDAEGADFCTYRLVEISPSRYEFRRTRYASFLLAVMFACGLASFAALVSCFFDRQVNRYWDDRYRDLNAKFDPQTPHETNLDQVGALQILTYLESEGEYYYYELNLVLRSGDRIAVTATAT